MPGMPSSTSQGSPSIPGMPSSSSDSSGSTASSSSSSSQGESGEEGGIDVNVSVNGTQIPGVLDTGAPGTPGFPGTPGQPGTTGTDSNAGMPGSPGVPAGNQGSGTDVARSGSTSGNNSGTQQGSTGAQGQAGGDIAYGTGDDPFATLGRPGGGVMTAAERRAVLDARLEESYADFDGMIIGERERAQTEANEAGSAVMGTGAGGGGGADGGDAGGFNIPEGAIVVAGGPQGSTGGGIMPNSTTAREGEFSNANQPTFDPPDDIPSGDDDDVVARQLREAAMHEPDPELREKLWDEYRNYTGLSQ
jgi:hypothetical protein